MINRHNGLPDSRRKRRTDPCGVTTKSAVARCIRDVADAGLAELGIAVADDWQHHGVGEMLIRALARSAWDSGIRCWNATLFTNNNAMRRFFELVGEKQSEQSEDACVVGLVYRLFLPSLARAEGHPGQRSQRVETGN